MDVLYVCVSIDESSCVCLNILCVNFVCGGVYVSRYACISVYYMNKVMYVCMNAPLNSKFASKAADIFPSSVAKRSSATKSTSFPTGIFFKILFFSDSLV